MFLQPHCSLQLSVTTFRSIPSVVWSSLPQFARPTALLGCHPAHLQSQSPSASALLPTKPPSTSHHPSKPSKGSSAELDLHALFTTSWLSRHNIHMYKQPVLFSFLNRLLREAGSRSRKERSQRPFDLHALFN